MLSHRAEATRDAPASADTPKPAETPKPATLTDSAPSFSVAGRRQMPALQVPMPRTRVRVSTSMAVSQVRRLIWLIVAVIDAIVTMDFVFRLIGASDAGFAHAMMVSGATLSGPFQGIFASVPRISGLTLRWSDGVVFLLAIIAGWALTWLTGVSGRGSHRQVVV